MEIDTLLEEATEIQDRTTALRHHLHRHPELGNYLPLTREAVLAELEDLPLDITLHETTSGVAALLTGARPGPTVMLRGDMDALPLTEDTGVEFSSTIDCQMHACGHDTHTAMLASAARVLAGRRDDFAGRVLFMFQPGEEGHHGARFMLDEGLLEVPDFADGTPSPVTGAFALHMTSSLPTGWVATRRGPVMAAADEFVIRITGRGGHASEPFRALDPIPIACEIVQALQMMVTRSVDVFDPAVVTVGQIHAGTTNNIIPEIAEINGTIRTVSEQTRSKVHDALKESGRRDRLGPWRRGPDRSGTRIPGHYQL
jgi:amidohydrolase